MMILTLAHEDLCDVINRIDPPTSDVINGSRLYQTISFNTSLKPLTNESQTRC
jgi:hypothetical protein